MDTVIDGFWELLLQNVPTKLPPGSQAAWRRLLAYCGGCFRFVGDSYGERLRIIKARPAWPWGKGLLIGLE